MIEKVTQGLCKGTGGLFENSGFSTYKPYTIGNDSAYRADGRDC
jgi:hypothetical protein